VVKVAIICRPFSFFGGVETATAGLLRELVSRGYDVDLLSTAGQGDVPGVRVRRLPVFRQPSLLRLLSFALAARAAVRSGGYDIVQSHERCLGQDIYRAGEGSHRGYLLAMGRDRAQWNPFHRTVCAVEERIFQLRSTRHIVAISRRDKAEIERLHGTPGERVSVIYNGVDLERFHPDNAGRYRQAIRAELGLTDRDWVVLFVGSGFERKGLGALISAWGALREPDWRLVVAGKGDPEPYRHRARSFGIDERVCFISPRRDVERLYAMADTVALPALYEPFGNVHLEAQASGVPVLTSARAGGAESIDHGASGWVLNEPSPAMVAAGLEALREIDGTRARDAARRSAEPFTYVAQADGFARLYRSLAGKERKPSN